MGFWTTENCRKKFDYKKNLEVILLNTLLQAEGSKLVSEHTNNIPYLSGSISLLRSQEFYKAFT